MGFLKILRANNPFLPSLASYVYGLRSQVSGLMSVVLFYPYVFIESSSTNAIGRKIKTGSHAHQSL